MIMSKVAIGLVLLCRYGGGDREIFKRNSGILYYKALHRMLIVVISETMKGDNDDNINCEGFKHVKIASS